MQSWMACGWVFGPIYGADTVAALPSGNALRASNALRATKASGERHAPSYLGRSAAHLRRYARLAG